ncbi:MAG TPA: amidohydrolase family protein [Protaetiibacter sp.]|nr:amidohydrolase family protein [Protaetiibacter sp.]
MTDERFLLAERLFDGETVRPWHAVGIADGRITRVLPEHELPAGAAVQRFPGATLTPGLVDAHVHMTPWMVFGLLAAGVTTVRDLGNDLDAVQAGLAALGTTPRPTIHWSGPLMEGERVNWPPVARAHADADAARATVAELAARGVRSIKLYYNATPEIMTAAAAEAHAHGMRVLGHVGATSFRETVAAGVDELQHLAGCLSADLGVEDADAAARELAAAPVDHCATLVVWQALAHLGSPAGARDTAMRWVHPMVRTAWADAYHATQPAAERAKRSHDLLERMTLVPPLLAAGRAVLVGSDSPFPGLIPGFALHDEAGLLVESGMSPLEVMHAVTAGNARVMGFADAGTIAAGTPADLALFAGDPTTAIADLGGIRATWLAGAELTPAALEADAASVFARSTASPVDQLARQRYVPGVANA